MCIFESFSLLSMDKKQLLVSGVIQEILGWLIHKGLYLLPPPPCTRACKLVQIVYGCICGSHLWKPSCPFFVFIPTYGRFPFWLILFRWVGSTTTTSFFFPRSTGGTWRIRKSAKDSTWEFNFYTKNLIPPKVRAQKIWTSKSPTPRPYPKKLQRSAEVLWLIISPPGKKKQTFRKWHLGMPC